MGCEAVQMGRNSSHALVSKIRDTSSNGKKSENLENHQGVLSYLPLSKIGSDCVHSAAQNPLSTLALMLNLVWMPV